MSFTSPGASFSNMSNTISSPSVLTSTPCDISCLVYMDAMTLQWPSTPVTSTILETIFINNGTPISTGQASLGDAAATSSGLLEGPPTLYINGTLTGNGVELIYPTPYAEILGFWIETDCSQCSSLSDCGGPEPPPGSPTAFPFKGITAAHPYYLDLEDENATLLFLSLVDLPSNCVVEVIGPPWALNPVSYLTETYTATSSYQEASPGVAVPSLTPKPSTTSGAYYLSTEPVAISSLTPQSIASSASSSSASSPNTQVSVTNLDTSSLSSPPLPHPTTTVQAPPTVTSETLKVTTKSESQYLVGSEILVPGGPAITVSGTTISLADSVIVINGYTQGFASASNEPANSPTATIGSSIIMANPFGPYLIGTETLTPGGAAITVSGITVSLATSATAIIVNGITRTLLANPALLPTSPPSTELPLLIIGGATLTANSASAYVLGTQSIVPGGPAITVSGTTISLVSSDAAIIVDGRTYTAEYVSSLSIPYPPAATVDGQIVSLNSAGAYEIGSQILTPGGPPITVDGTLVLLEPTGTELDVVNGESTSAITVAEPGSTQGLGGIIISALGGLPTQSVTGSPLIDTSVARACWEIDWRVFIVMSTSAVPYIGLLW